MTEQHISTMELAQITAGLKQKLHQLKGRRVVIVGDIGLDEYVLGEVRRISPEAPVPVVEVKSQDARLGLAANVAQNVSSLGGEALLVSVIGQDHTGEVLRRHLQEAGVSPANLVVDGSRPTTRKLRVMAEHHHVVRVDFELRQYLPPPVEQHLLQKLQALIPGADAVVIEDYSKGVLSEACIQEVIRLSHEHGKKVLVDPNRSTPLRFYKGVDLMTPNREEAVSLSGLSDDDLRISKDFLLDVGHALRDKAQARHVVITRGKEGMSLFDREKVVHLPTYARQVFDVTGAGDTVIAAMALAWGSGLSLEESCVLANFAAGVVVGKVGCVPCHTPELVAYMESHPLA